MTQTKTKLQDVALIAVFCAITVVPLIGAIVQQDEMVSEKENRNLNQLPEWPSSLQALAEWPQAFNNYYTDQFGFREKLNKFYGRLIAKLDWSGYAADATLGRDGWVFLGSPMPGYTGFGDPFGDAMHRNLYSQEDLASFAANAQATEAWLAERGAKLIFMVAPNKHTIYFDKLPEGISKQNDESGTDQLVRYLRDNTSIAVVDPRDALLEAKGDTLVYEIAGTHWNHFGANIGQFELMRVVQDLFPGQVQPALLPAGQFEMVFQPDSDLEGFIQGYKSGGAELPSPVFIEACAPEKTFVTDTRGPAMDGAAPEIFHTDCDDGELNALIFRDSFFLTMEPYVSRQFGRATFVWQMMTPELLEQYVSAENPDVVIVEFVERIVPFVVPPAPDS